MEKQSSLHLQDEAATQALGATLSAGLAPGRSLYLSGDLGTGKTTLVRGLLRALGHEGHVKSPTYALVELYSISRFNLYHFDFYRFDNAGEWLSSGFRDYFSPDSVCVVEWPERAGDLLPMPDLHIRLTYTGVTRNAALAASTPAGARWLDHALRAA